MTKDFEFSVTPLKHPCEEFTYGTRIGIHWELLLENTASIAQIHLIFKYRLENILEQYPKLYLSGKSNLRSACHYIAPEYVWYQKLKFDMEIFLHEYIPRINDLLAHGVLSTWMAAKLLTGVVRALSNQHKSSRIFFWLATRLVESFAITFKKILENPKKINKYENFFSFIFNHYQHLVKFCGISVLRILVNFGLPLYFMQEIYLQYKDNNAARKDLQNWTNTELNSFINEFKLYCEENGYNEFDLNNFIKVILTYRADLKNKSKDLDFQINFSPLTLGSSSFISPLTDQKLMPLIGILQFNLPTMQFYKLAERVAPINALNSAHNQTPQKISPVLKNCLTNRNIIFANSALIAKNLLPPHFSSEFSK